MIINENLAGCFLCSAALINKIKFKDTIYSSIQNIVISRNKSNKSEKGEIFRGNYCLLWKAFLSLLAIFWNSAFKWVYLSFSPLPFASLLFSAICRASPDKHFDFLHFFFLWMVLITASSTVL